MACLQKGFISAPDSTYCLIKWSKWKVVFKLGTTHHVQGVFGPGNVSDLQVSCVMFCFLH